MELFEPNVSVDFSVIALIGSIDMKGLPVLVAEWEFTTSQEFLCSSSKTETGTPVFQVLFSHCHLWPDSRDTPNLFLNVSTSNC
jgi:hypothetical protein